MYENLAKQIWPGLDHVAGDPTPVEYLCEDPDDPEAVIGGCIREKNLDELVTYAGSMLVYLTVEPESESRWIFWECGCWTVFPQEALTYDLAL